MACLPGASPPDAVPDPRDLPPCSSSSTRLPPCSTSYPGHHSPGQQTSLPQAHLSLPDLLAKPPSTSTDLGPVCSRNHQIAVEGKQSWCASCSHRKGFWTSQVASAFKGEKMAGEARKDSSTYLSGHELQRLANNARSKRLKDIQTKKKAKETHDISAAGNGGHHLHLESERNIVEHDLEQTGECNVEHEAVEGVAPSLNDGTQTTRQGSSNSLTKYELQRLDNIARNKRVLQSYNIPTMCNTVPDIQTKKKTKKTQDTSAAANGGHNLRPRSQRTGVENEEEQSGEDNLVLNSDNNEVMNSDGIQKKRKGRGVTKMEDIYARGDDLPKLTIILNEYGQPVGPNSDKFSSVVGTVVRRKIQVGCKDWRLVPPEKKLAVWTTLQTLYNLDEDAQKWVIATAGKKWKDFKSYLKEKYFDDNLTDQELMAGKDKRVTDADWKYLINHWRSPKFEQNSETGKGNRSKLVLLHTSGSKSHARVAHEMNKLAAVAKTRPELKEKTIQNGDLYAHVCGKKEPRGCVRVIGLGPTPQDVGTPGVKCYTSTRLQMEILARQKAEKEAAGLTCAMKEMQERMERMEQNILSLQGRPNFETMSNHGSNSK